MATNSASMHARKRLAELVAAFGGLEATSRAMSAAGTPIRADSLKRLLRPDSGREIRPALLEELEAIADDKPRWLMARDGGERWVIHLHNPPFAAKVVGGELTSISWFCGAPPARVHGDLLKQARAYLSESR